MSEFCKTFSTLKPNASTTITSQRKSAVTVAGVSYMWFYNFFKLIDLKRFIFEWKGQVIINTFKNTKGHLNYI